MYRVMLKGQVIDDSRKLDRARAQHVAAAHDAVVQWKDPDTGDWVLISEPGGAMLPRSKWRLPDVLPAVRVRSRR